MPTMQKHRPVMIHRAPSALMERYGEMQLPEEILKRWLMTREANFTAENIDEEFAKMIPDLKWQLITDKIAEQRQARGDRRRHARICPWHGCTAARPIWHDQHGH